MKTRGRLGMGVGVGALLSLGLVAGVAHAKEPGRGTSVSGSPGEAAVADPDVVRLKNGGLMRGKISELVPGASVTIVTITGKTREFSMSEVDYAGPAAKDPQLSAAPKPAPSEKSASNDDERLGSSERHGGKGAEAHVTVHGEEARLHLVADEQGITFHRQSTSAVAFGPGGSAFAMGYERICTAPCEVSLPAGTETMALSREGKPPIAAEPLTLPTGQSELRGSFESRAGVRTAGWLLAIGGGVAGGVLVLTASEKTEDCSLSPCLKTTRLNAGQLIGGTVLMSAGVGVGLLMAFIPDKAVVEVTSGSAALSRPLSVARGVTLSGRF